MADTMKLYRPLLIALLGLALLAASCGSERVYTDQGNGFSIAYSRDWSIMPQGSWEEGVLIDFRGPKGCGGLVPDFDVSRIEPSPPATLESWFAGEKVKMEASTGYSLVSEEETAVAGVPAVEYVFTIDVYGVPVKVMRVYLVSDSSGWLINGVCSPDCWSDCQPVFDRAAASFRLLD